VKCADDKGGRATETTQNIEREKSQVTHRILDIIPEYPKEQNIAEDVPPIGMQEHRSDKRKVTRNCSEVREFQQQG
jgi:hypothetical protein